MLLRCSAAVIALLSLTSCDIPTPGEALDTFGLRPVAAEPQIDGPVNARCQAVARQRAQDGALNGGDAETQQEIFSGTYSQCAAYEAAHGPG